MHSLQDEDNLEVLTALANRELSFGEATRKVEELKSWKRTRDSYFPERSEGPYVRGSTTVVSTIC